MHPDADVLESRFAALDAIEQTAAGEARMWVHKADRLGQLIAITPGELQKGLPGEVGAALTVGEGVARDLLDTAWELRRHPRVRTAVLEARMNPRQAQVVLDELAAVDPAVADRILDELLEVAGGPVALRPERLRAWVNRRTLAADPDGARKKRVLAEREETGVRYRALRNGLAQKITTGPAVDIQKAMRQLDALTPPVSPEDDRTRGQLLTDTDLGAISNAASRAGVLPVPLELELKIPIKSGAYTLTPVSRLPEPVVIRTDLAGLAEIVKGTPLEGMFRTDPAAGDQNGVGDEHAAATERPAPGDDTHAPSTYIEREPEQQPTDVQHQPGTDNTAGADVDSDSDSDSDYPFALVPHQRSQAIRTLADLVDRDTRRGGNRKGGSPEFRLEQLIARHGRQIIEIHGHHDDPDTNTDGDGDGDGPTGDHGPGGTGPRRPDSKGPSGTGRSATLRPADPPAPAPKPEPGIAPGAASTGYALPPASVPTLAGHGPIDPDLVRRYLTDSDAKVRRLFADPVTGICAVDPKPIDLKHAGTAPIPPPPPATVAYKPTAAQRRVVIARYQQCSFPGCGGRAHHADLDHAVPFDDGGETTVANLHPLCRFHHQVKQRGWSVTRAPDGSSLWTSPAGKHYRSTPGEQ